MKINIPNQYRPVELLPAERSFYKLDRGEFRKHLLESVGEVTIDLQKLGRESVRTTAKCCASNSCSAQMIYLSGNCSAKMKGKNTLMRMCNTVRKQTGNCKVFVVGDLSAQCREDVNSVINVHENGIVFRGEEEALSVALQVKSVHVYEGDIGFCLLKYPDIELSVYGAPFYLNVEGVTNRSLTTVHDDDVVTFEYAWSVYLTTVTLIPGIGETEYGLKSLISESSLAQQKFTVTKKTLIGCNFPAWKRKWIDKFLPGVSAIKYKYGETISADLLHWGHSDVLSDRKDARSILTIEDGFVRSIGLGTNFTTPRSLVVDDKGIHYDCSVESRIESILFNSEYTHGELELADKAIELMVENDVYKYNIQNKSDFDAPINSILVVGQVDQDKSIKYGGCGIESSFELLKRVKEANPGRFIVFKPHPDVTSKNRNNTAGQDKIGDYADLVVDDVPISELLLKCSDVHVITSLLGFEALIRGAKVHCHGMPFYAGWGLTTDYATTPRRGRQLSIDELVLGSLFVYPQYISKFGKPEVSFLKYVADLIKENEQKPKTFFTMPKAITKLINLIRG
ncbi:hypothetical protein [Vibrio barjaei]|uniref:capsular polysaccharide export protein, LipB/KpsS family n=1 Tax=Vibrio barjaei TaxID=1676683 RepID=UPI00228345E8|nr:hypothetical protein [Vibrio barjaei]MCY9872368.1 hypothetical protein [Vibrio barjaei]